MEMHLPWMVQYVVGSVKKEADKCPPNFVEQWIVLCAHDKMTAQANDSHVKSQVFEDGKLELTSKDDAHQAQLAQGSSLLTFAHQKRQPQGIHWKGMVIAVSE